MNIERFVTSDIDAFLRYASAENWISTRWEIDFLLDAFPEGCLTCRWGGLPVAFITSVKYDKSGWIGNLLVDPVLRGKGIGSVLMERALEALRRAGAETVWLTASAAGRPIYEKRGFVEIDRIRRWKGNGIDGLREFSDGISLEEAVILDQMGWGDRRDALLSAACSRGSIFGREDAFLILQDNGALMQGGPWACSEPEGASYLLNAALNSLSSTTEIAFDVPEMNEMAAALLESQGFRLAGSNSLMFWGTLPAYNPEKIFALGSMGSMG